MTADEVTTAALADDPHPIWHALRPRGDVVWVAALGGWVTLSRAAAVAVMNDPVTFTVDDPRFTTARVIGRSMLSTDGDEHTRHRTPFAKAMGGRAQQRRPAALVAIAAEARRLVELGVARGSGATFDARADLAAPLAAWTIRRLVGLDRVPLDELLGWYRSIVADTEALDPSAPPEPVTSVAFDLLRSAVVDSISTGASEVACRAAHSLTPDEVASNIAVMCFGAIETSEAAIANAVVAAVRHRGAGAVVPAGPGGSSVAVAALVEESLRLEPPAASVHRYATRNVHLAGVDIGAGDFVDVSLAAANRDPAVWEQPDRFRLGRPNARQQLSFAVGPHACLASHLARAEAELAVTALVERAPGLLPARDLPPARGLVFRKPPEVPLILR